MAVGGHYPQLTVQGAGKWLRVPYSIVTGKGAGSEGIDGAMGHGPSGNQLVFAIQVRWEDVEDALFELFGGYYFDQGTGLLNRDLPKPHPWMPWLYASRATSIKPFVQDGNEIRIGGYPYGVWTHCIITILFQQPKYAVLSDAALDGVNAPINIGGTLFRQEWQRFTEFLPKSGCEVLTVEGGSGAFKWVEGPQAGQAFPAPTTQFLSKPDLLVVWRQVPYYGLFNSDHEASQIEAAMGKVNSAVFLGRDVGTLHLAGYDISYNEAPYSPTRFNAGSILNGNTYTPSLTCDVTLQFRSFTGVPGTGNYQGHNTAPNRTDGLWYLISHDGTNTGKRIFESYDFRKMFVRAS